MLVAQRWILAALRHRGSSAWPSSTRRSGTACPRSTRARCSKLGVSRRELFEQLDRPCCARSRRPATSSPSGATAGVNIDYHVDVEHNYYSVPYQLVAPAGRGPADRDDRRAVPQGPPHRLASPPLGPRGVRHRSRAHAACASRPRRVDALPADRVGRDDRARDGRARRRHPRRPSRTPSRAIAPAWASCGLASATAPRGSRPRAARATRLGAPSYRTVQEHPGQRRRRPPASMGSARAPLAARAPQHPRQCLLHKRGDAMLAHATVDK